MYVCGKLLETISNEEIKGGGMHISQQFFSRFKGSVGTEFQVSIAKPLAPASRGFDIVEFFLKIFGPPTFKIVLLAMVFHDNIERSVKRLRNKDRYHLESIQKCKNQNNYSFKEFSLLKA